MFTNDSTNLINFIENINNKNISKENISEKTRNILKKLFDQKVEKIKEIDKTKFHKIKNSNKYNIPKILQFYQFLLKNKLINQDLYIDELIKLYPKNPNKILKKILKYFEDNDIFIENLYKIFYDLNDQHLNFLQIEPECKDLYGSFCTIDVQKYIENNICYLHEFQYKYKNNQVKFIIGTHTKFIKINLDKIFESINLILELSNASNKNILIKFWDIDLKKKFNNACQKIGSSQVNSAVTKFFDNFSINLWRREELLKVILHELMHFLELDFHNYPIEMNQFIYNIINISPNHEIRLYESYVECWATILHLIYIIKNIITKNQDFIYLFEHLWNQEKHFMCFQVAKILLHFNFNSFNDFIDYKNNKNFNDCKLQCPYKESSSIISYFIIKAAFFVNIDKFIDFCNNKDLILNFGNSESRYDCFTKLIGICLKSNNFKKLVSYYLNKINSIQNKNLFPLKTFRMTINEIDIILRKDFKKTKNKKFKKTKNKKKFKVNIKTGGSEEKKCENIHGDHRTRELIESNTDNLLGINNRLVFSLGELNQETGNFIDIYSCKICGKNIKFPNNLIKKWNECEEKYGPHIIHFNEPAERMIKTNLDKSLKNITMNQLKDMDLTVEQLKQKGYPDNIIETFSKYEPCKFDYYQCQNCGKLIKISKVQQVGCKQQ